MRWIKLHGNMLSDDRLQHVLDEQRFAGIGLYYFMLQLVECQGEGAIAFNQVIGALERRYSRKKILRFIQDYDLFVLTEEGLVLSVDPIPGYTQEETEELRRSDAIDAVSRARVFARSHVSPGVHAHDTCAGVKEKIRKEKSRGNTLFQKPSVEEVAAYCAERGNGIDAQYFLDFYEARGWKYGHTRITDWKACVRTWERNQRTIPTTKEPPPSSPVSTHLEEIDELGNRYVNGRLIPADAPPRPSPTAEWDDSSSTWFEFYH